jgi:hypothetical protein
VVAAGAGSSCGTSPSRYPLPSGQEWLVESIEEVTSTCEILPMQGTVEMPDLGSVTMYGSQSLAGASCTSPTDESRTVEPVTLDAFMLPVALVDFEGE